MSIGEKIKEERKKAGLSQEQLAEKIDVSRQAIQNGKRVKVFQIFLI